MKAGKVKLLFGDGRVRPVPAHLVAEAKERFGAVDPPKTSFGAPRSFAAGREMAGRAASALPAVGGIVGGGVGALVGAPALALGPWGAVVPAAMGVSGAGVGGSAGRMAEIAAKRAMGLPSPSASSIGGAGMEQAAYEAGGRGLAGVASAAARPLMSAAMGNPVIQEGMDVVRANLEKVRAPVGRGLSARFGGRKAIESVRQSDRVLGRHLVEMAEGGVKVNGTAAVDRAYEKVSKAFSLHSGDASQAQLNELYEQAINRHGRMHDPRLANNLKQTWDRGSKPVLRQLEKDLPVEPQTAVRAVWDKALADEMRDEIESESARFAGTALTESPARAINKVTQERIGVKSAIRKAEKSKRRVSPVVTGLGAAAAGVPAGFAGHDVFAAGIPAIVGALGAHAVTQPEVTSRAALALTDPAMQQALRMSPRLLQLLRSAPQDATRTE